MTYDLTKAAGAVLYGTYLEATERGYVTDKQCFTKEKQLCLIFLTIYAKNLQLKGIFFYKNMCSFYILWKKQHQNVMNYNNKEAKSS